VLIREFQLVRNRSAADLMSHQLHGQGGVRMGETKANEVAIPVVAARRKKHSFDARRTCPSCEVRSGTLASRLVANGDLEAAQRRRHQQGLRGWRLALSCLQPRSL
jgi:hypothetical protein